VGAEEAVDVTDDKEKKENRQKSIFEGGLHFDTKRRCAHKLGYVVSQI
jgi:hypothetical protein